MCRVLLYPLLQWCCTTPAAFHDLPPPKDLSQMPRASSVPTIIMPLLFVSRNLRIWSRSCPNGPHPHPVGRCEDDDEVVVAATSFLRLPCGINDRDVTDCDEEEYVFIKREEEDDDTDEEDVAVVVEVKLVAMRPRCW